MPSQALRVRETSSAQDASASAAAASSVRVPAAGPAGSASAMQRRGRGQHAPRTAARPRPRTGRRRAARLSTSRAPREPAEPPQVACARAAARGPSANDEARGREHHRRHQQARRGHVVAEEARAAGCPSCRSRGSSTGAASRPPAPGRRAARRPARARGRARRRAASRRPGRAARRARASWRSRARRSGAGENEAESSVHTQKARIGPSSGSRGMRARSRRTRRARNTTAARARQQLRREDRDEQVAATAATSASWARSSLTLRDGRFLREHDRDVVAHRIDALALGAAQAGAVLHQLHGRLAHRAGQDLEQVGMDRHGPSLRHSPFASQTDPRPAAARSSSCRRTRRTRRAVSPETTDDAGPEARDRSALT